MSTSRFSNDSKVHIDKLSNASSSHSSSPRYIKRENQVIDLSDITTDFFTHNQQELVLNDIPLSEIGSQNSQATSIGVQMITKTLKNQLDNLSPMQVTYKILKLIKKLENIKHRRFTLYEFIDMLRDLVYNDVSLILFEEYKRKARFIPKAHYLHYYVYFLHYCEYYHDSRYKLNRSDVKLKAYHSLYLKNTRDQLNYIHNIINTNKKIEAGRESTKHKLLKSQHSNSGNDEINL